MQRKKWPVLREEFDRSDSRAVESGKVHVNMKVQCKKTNGGSMRYH